MSEESSIFTVKQLKAGKLPGLKKKKVQKEEKVQIKVCNYLHKAYPRVIFTCDLSSGMRLPIHIAAKNKKMRSSRGLPDLFIATPQFKFKREYGGDMGNRVISEDKIITYTGLFMELKSEDTVIFNRDGSLRKDEHLQEQQAILTDLQGKGYKAVFAVGYKQAVDIIDEYMKNISNI